MRMGFFIIVGAHDVFRQEIDVGFGRPGIRMKSLLRICCSWRVFYPLKVSRAGDSSKWEPVEIEEVIGWFCHDWVYDDHIGGVESFNGPFRLLMRRVATTR